MPQDYTGRNLSGRDFSGQDLRGAIFDRANLRGATFDRADLREAQFVGADLSQASLYRANLEDSCLKGTGLSYSNLTEAKLNRSDLIRSQLICAVLTDAELNYSKLKQANLSRAKLNRAKLERSRLDNCVLERADLSATKLMGAYLIGADLMSANLTEADLRYAHLDRAFLRNTNLHKANLSNTELYSTSFADAVLTEAIFEKTKFYHVELAGADLSRINLREAHVTESDLSFVKLENADLTSTFFYRSNMQGANLKHTILNEARLEYVNLIGSVLYNPEMIGSIFFFSDLSIAKLIDADFSQANLNEVRLLGTCLKDLNSNNSNFNFYSYLEELLSLYKKAFLLLSVTIDSHSLSIDFFDPSYINDFSTSYNNMSNYWRDSQNIDVQNIEELLHLSCHMIEKRTALIYEIIGAVKAKIRVIQYQSSLDSSENPYQTETYFPPYLITAGVRALESQMPYPYRLFHDDLAPRLAGEQIINRIRELELVDERRPYIAVRTRFFDDFLKRLFQDSDSSITQVVFLGAGLDTRAFRLGCLSTVNIYELDKPEVIRLKQDKLNQINTSRSSHFLIEADLNLDSWAELLQKRGYKHTLPSVWLLEGLLMYFTEEQVRNLFLKIQKITAFGSSIGADLIDRKATQIREDSWLSGFDNPSELLNEYGWHNPQVTQPGEDGANFNRYMQPYPDEDNDFGRAFFVTAQKT